MWRGKQNPRCLDNKSTIVWDSQLWKYLWESTEKMKMVHVDNSVCVIVYVADNHTQKNWLPALKGIRMLRQMPLSDLHSFLPKYMKHSEIEVLTPCTDGQREHALSCML